MADHMISFFDSIYKGAYLANDPACLMPEKMWQIMVGTLDPIFQKATMGSRVLTPYTRCNRLKIHLHNTQR